MNFKIFQQYLKFCRTLFFIIGISKIYHLVDRVIRLIGVESLDLNYIFYVFALVNICFCLSLINHATIIL
jgi:hypothetical protein